jgi:hypothetical protein
MPADREVRKEVTRDMIDRGAREIAGEPRCYCDDDWRVPTFSGCPAHGDGAWPDDHHRRTAERVLRAALEDQRA